MPDCHCFNGPVPKSDRAIRMRIHVLEEHIEDCERYYPWPALIEVWRQEIASLQNVLTTSLKRN